MDIRASKVAGTLRFFEEGGRGLVAGPFEGVLHLFEHHYHPALMPFWYGAAEVGWDAPAFLRAFGQVPIYQQVVHVVLEDGRRGRADFGPTWGGRDTRRRGFTRVEGLGPFCRNPRRLRRAA